MLMDHLLPLLLGNKEVHNGLDYLNCYAILVQDGVLGMLEFSIEPPDGIKAFFHLCRV